MSKFIPVLLLLSLFLAGSASAYGIYLNCSPLTIPVGQTIKCSVDSNFPAGTSFNLVFYQSQYTSTLIDSQAMATQPNQAHPVHALRYHRSPRRPVTRSRSSSTVL